MENLSEGCCDCYCCCDGDKTKSTPSLLALGLGWSLTILEHSLNLCVKNNANMKGVWVFDMSKVRRNSVEYSNPYKKIKEGQKYA